jgi:hypothetical protein
MSSVTPFPKDNAEAESSSVDRTVDAIRLLLESLSPHERERVRRALGTELRPIETPRAGEVLSTIVQLLPQRENWTAKQFKEQVADRGVGATDKEIQNALAYLTRRGHISRVGYGQYRVDGTVVTNAVDLGGGTVRNSEHYD